MTNSVKLNRALGRGERSYNTFLGEWWHRRSMDSSHRSAYERIADHIAKTFKKDKKTPRVIVDYACGNGGATSFLAQRFPRARIVAIDGSERMLILARFGLKQAGHDADFVSLDQAFENSGPRIRLLKTPLPEFSLAEHRADVVLFGFPNMNFSSRHLARIKRQVFGNRQDCRIARFLSRLPNIDHPDDDTPEAEIYEDLLYERAISRNVHGLLKRGGYWIKVDYSNSFRQDLSELIQWRLLFSESALHVGMEDPPQRDPFVFLDSDHYRSQVILDVYQQTHKASDKTGGYMMTTFRAR